MSITSRFPSIGRRGASGENIRRSHALAPEDNAAKLSSDLAVVDDEGGLACCWGVGRSAIEVPLDGVTRTG